ncbi:MAG: IclR family transcriptional regulator [Chloroflexota bacterium]
MSVQSLERAFSILDTIANSPDETGVTAIGELTGLHKATVSRLLGTLEQLGAVERLPANDGFRIGKTILSLAKQIDPSTQLVQIARPHLQELADITGEAASLEIPDGQSILYIDQVQTQHHIRVNSWVGRIYPIHTITSGPIFMGNWSERAIKRYFSRKISRPAPHTITSYKAMKEVIEEVEELGYAYASDQYELGLTGVSAPIINDQGDAVAAINVCGPTFRFPAEGQLSNVVSRITKAANAISKIILATEQDNNWEIKEIEPNSIVTEFKA